MENSSLYDQDTFYKQFERDLAHARHEVIIESPFITTRRITTLLPILAKLHRQGVSIIINTRDPVEHGGDYYYQTLDAVATMQEMGIKVLYNYWSSSKSSNHRPRSILRG